MPSPDLTLLRPGVRVKLRGDAKPQPNKPYPKGWQTVAEMNAPAFEAGSYRNYPASSIRVESDLRWLPVSLIEEIAP
jgi:hypothetical protein